MSIGTALVIVALLYLIDKHGLWKKAGWISLIAVAAVLVAFVAYYGWQTWRDRKERTASNAPLDFYPDTPVWNPAPPEGFIGISDVSYDILVRVKANETEKTNAWDWYQHTQCVGVGEPKPATHALHKNDLFILDSYDSKWMSDIALPPEVKRALWNAKVAECRIPSGTKGAKACLDRATGAIDAGPWAEYKKDCGPKMEMIYLNSGLSE